MVFYNCFDVGSMDDLYEFIQPPTVLLRITYLRCAKNVSDDPTFEYDNDNKMIKYSRYKKYNYSSILVRSLTFTSFQLY